MSEEPQAADWTRLPADPLGFFGLEPAFELGELRRRYARLLKAWRPEEYPREFELLRAAYEALRDGREPVQDREPAPSGAPVEFEHLAGARPVAPAPARALPSSAHPLRLVDGVASAPASLPEELLRARRDWCALTPLELAEVVRGADRRHSELDATALGDLEEIEALLEYARKRADFLSGHPLRAELDRVLRKAVRAGEEEAEAEALAALQRLAERPAELLRALPYGEDWNFVWTPFANCVARLRRRAPRRVQGSEGAKDVAAVLAELDRCTRASWLGWVWQRVRGLTSASLAVASGLALLAWGDPHSIVDWMVALFCFGCLQLGSLPLVRGLVEPLLARRAHQRLWRPRLLSALAAGRLTLSELSRACARDQGEFTRRLAACLREDYAPEHYEAALRCVRA